MGELDYVINDAIAACYRHPDGLGADGMIFRPSFCKYVHKHISEKKITPEIWATCETGCIDSVKYCPHWRGESDFEKSRLLREKK